ncbi:MAG: alkaline phosphatase family protein [Pseudonocardiales bacterium]|nr:alkaline phosphatase family protein [Pseudonocardiales bacterium]MBV9730242.1 alkaline phosphatase family protein [Pseudonocardiales bacterium]
MRVAPTLLTTRSRGHDVTRRRTRLDIIAAAAAVAATLASTFPAAASAKDHDEQTTATPIQHLVVIFQENVSFDHYFATYPRATNPEGEPAFHAAPHTPAVNGLTPALLTHNPNAANPMRLDRSEPLTCDQNHDYTPEQKAFDGGKMDRFVENTQTVSCAAPDIGKPGLVMDYYDGNTVTALWNYAQHFALSDNSYDTVFGPSTPGALNLISGQTHGATPGSVDSEVVSGTVIGDPNPTFDDCSAGTTVATSGPNVGDLLNAKGTTWGFFQGGFRPTTPANPSTGAKAVCGSSHTNVGGASVGDYSAHHEPFQYYASTANPHHLPPSSAAAIGHTDAANHQYDLTDFTTALQAGNLPAVSFLKAAEYQDGHAGYSDPLDEQHFLVNTLNALQRSKDWRSTAVVIAYDDSDGWYDHQPSPIINPSQSPQDALTAPGICGSTATPLAGFADRCGYGPRLPLLVISPFAKQNFVDHTVTDQSSILRFIEDNWLSGQRIGGGSFDALAGPLIPMFNFHHHAGTLILDPATGARAER